MKRRSRIVITALPVARAAGIATARPGASALVAGARTASSPGDITGASVGIPQTSPTSGGGDTWYNTWAADGNIYATSDDSHGFNGTCNSNFVVNELTGS